MKQRLVKSPLFSDEGKSLRILKIVTIVAPPLFVFVLELLRHTFFEETRPMIWGTLALLIIVTVAAFFFSKIVFAVIDRLQKENTHRMRELEILSEVHQTLDESHNLNDLLNRSMYKLNQITSADSSELYLIDEKSHELVHTLHSGLLGDVFKQETQLQLKEWLMNEGARLNQQLIMENLKNLQGWSIATLADAGVRSLVVVPLKKSDSNVIGVVCLFSLHLDHFKQNEANLLLKIGNLIAVAIENMQLHEKVQASAVLEERERISTELHDGLAQVLGYVITKSQATRQLLRKMTVASDYLGELEDVAQKVYTDTRETILGLKTAISGDRSMVSALREYAARFSQMHGIKTELVVGEHIIPSLSPQVELQIIRIVQEALSNVRKHAEATQATINVEAGEGWVTIVVKDDGKGFDVEKNEERDWAKYGLRNMQERADSIHGSLIIESRLGKGTEITVSVPSSFSQDAVQEGEEIESTNR
jgi:signal transduction histidine kinase